MIAYRKLTKTCALLAILAVLNLSQAAFASIQRYTDRSDFQAATTTNYSWDMEDLPDPFPNPLSALHNYSGPGTLELVRATSTDFPTSFSAFVGLEVAGRHIFLNPQDDFLFTNPIDAFGMGLIWADRFTIKDVTMHLLDANGSTIASLAALTSADASEEIDTTFGLRYMGFYGFTSSTPVYGISLTQQPGATYYDNFLWNEEVPVGNVPEPAAFFVWSLLGLAASCAVRRKR